MGPPIRKIYQSGSNKATMIFDMKSLFNRVIKRFHCNLLVQTWKKYEQMKTNKLDENAERSKENR